MKNREMQTSNTAEMVTISRAEYERFQVQAQVITSLTLQNEWLLEQLKLSKKKLFGRSSEQAEQMVMEQLSFTYVPVGTGETCFRRAIVVGKCDAGENSAEICAGEGHPLPAGAVA